MAIVQFDHVAQQVSDIGAALEWWQQMVPGATVLYADGTWGLLEAGGVRLSGEELERLAAEHGASVATHRDASRSFYLEAPGGHGLEVIAYPDAVAEDAE